MNILNWLRRQFRKIYYIRNDSPEKKKKNNLGNPDKRSLGHEARHRQSFLGGQTALILRCDEIGVHRESRPWYCLPLPSRREGEWVSGRCL